MPCPLVQKKVRQIVSARGQKRIAEKTSFPISFKVIYPKYYKNSWTFVNVGRLGRLGITDNFCIFAKKLYVLILMVQVFFIFSCQNGYKIKVSIFYSLHTKKLINIKVRKISILSKYAVLVYLVLRAKSGSLELHYSLHEYESIVPNFCRNDELSSSLS